jgi:hypothetical protein
MVSTFKVETIFLYGHIAYAQKLQPRGTLDWRVNQPHA